MLRLSARRRAILVAVVAVAALVVQLAGGTHAGARRSTSTSVRSLGVSTKRTTPVEANTSIGFRSATKLHDHYVKHGREFGSITEAQYLTMAQTLRDAPLSASVIEATQPGGTISRFDRDSGAFMAFDTDLTIRTFFKPNDGEAYFRRAAKVSH